MANIVCNTLEAFRQRRGLSQRMLSESAGITRQAVGLIESGRMQPSVGIALGLARALGASVEDLFGAAADSEPHARVARATIGGRVVTYALDEDHLAIEPGASPVPNVFLGGCDLSVGLLSRHALTRSRDMRVLWLTMTNRAALEALARGDLHAAVVHDTARSDDAEPLNEFVRFEVATTEAGWLVGNGNPLGLGGAADISRKQARFVNRPAGAGARRLLDSELRRTKTDSRRIVGYERELSGQLDAGRAVAQGFADAAIGLASVARVFDLDFVPLREERCALLVPAAALQTPEIRTLLDALRSAPFRRDLEALKSYDVTRTGEKIA